MAFLKLFGGASLQENGEVLSGPAAQRHRLALLALLAVAYPQASPRERLTALLWPERDQQHARNLLSQAVSAVRKALGEDAILCLREELRLNPATVRCDLIEFEEALRTGDLERAVAVYTGPLLEGFFIPSAAEFERWVDDERERLRRSHCKTLEDLAHGAAAQGDCARAVEWARQLCSEEPYSSRVTLCLMQALEAVGDRAAAIQQARVHTLLLQEEFGATPDAAVLELAERIRAGVEQPPASYGPRRPELGPPALEARATPTSFDDFADEEGAPDLRLRVKKPARGGRRGSWRHGVGLTAVLLLLAFAAWASLNVRGGKPAEIGRLAVLPLANLTGDPDQDHFVAGMHDVLVAELAQIDALTVYSRQSVLRYQGSDLSLPAIARELGVDALVEGSVFRSGDSVRITVQLVRAQPEEHLWAASQQGSISNGIALQAQVARAIAGAIQAQITPEVEARLARARAVHQDAQDAYMRGLYQLARASHGHLIPVADRLEARRTAIRHLEEAAALEPEWAAAHAKLALAYQGLASEFAGEREAEYYPRTKLAALRAVALDETESQAHVSLGVVLYRYEWDWAGAERAFRRALELDPNSHHWSYASYLQAAGRHEEAITHFRMAEARNPLSELLKAQVASAYACAGRYDEAIAQTRELHERIGGAAQTDLIGDAAGTGLLGYLGRLHSLKGMHVEAIAAMEESVALTDSLPAALSGLALVSARAGRVDEARQLADRLEAETRAAGRVWRPAHLYAALGDTERALDMVEAAFEGRRSMRPRFRCSFTYELLRDEPRMQEMLRPVGFPS